MAVNPDNVVVPTPDADGASFGVEEIVGEPCRMYLLPLNEGQKSDLRSTRVGGIWNCA